MKITKKDMPLSENNLLSPTEHLSANQHIASSYYNNFFKNLKHLFNDERFYDVELTAGESTIKAHRVVLSASSSYFDAMFGSDFNENKNKIVKFHSISYSILKPLIEFIYTGKIEINQMNCQELLAAADMLQLNEVVDACSMYLCRELHSTNALGILRFAEAHNCQELLTSANEFICTHFSEIAEQDEILDISSQMFSRLISSEMIRVDSEYQVFSAAMRWIKHEVNNRKRFVFDILANVRLSLVPVALIENEISQCRDMSLQIALKSILKDLTMKRGQLVKTTHNPRFGAKKSIYLIGGSKRESTSGWGNDCIYDSVIKYDIFRKEWIDAAPMAIGRILPGCTVLNSKIYVVGGERGSQIFANGEVYDPLSNTWENLPPMNTPRCEFGLCALGLTLFAIGGWIGEDIGDSIESYDPISKKWQIVDKLPEPRFSMGVVSFEGLIYIVGGCTQSSRHLPDLISYNPVTKEFTHLSKMQVARCQIGVAILGRYLYVVGGNSSHQEVLQTVERYSFDEDKWTTVCNMAFPRASPAVSSADGLLYVAGGDQVCNYLML